MYAGTSSNILKWEDRLQIAADSAQGLPLSDVHSPFLAFPLSFYF